MSIIRTDEWFTKKKYSVEAVLNRLPEQKYSMKEVKDILVGNGLCPYSESGPMVMESLKEQKVWSLVRRYFHKYKRLWNGPDVPIYILPLNIHNRAIMNNSNGKSGVAFSNMLFLFLSDRPDPKEIEALFVHEYHHVCRFQALKNKIPHFTLLDSIIMEGLAEHAVLEYCGKKYLAKWSNLYSEKQLKQWWKRWFYPNLSIRKEKKLHDSLLYGRKMFPMMVGYSVGFFLISEFTKNENFSTKAFMTEPSETFVL